VSVNTWRAGACSDLSHMYRVDGIPYETICQPGLPRVVVLVANTTTGCGQWFGTKLAKKRVGAIPAPKPTSKPGRAKGRHDMAKQAKSEEKKGNGQKGKSRLEIAQEAHEKAIAKAAMAEERLAKAKKAGSLVLEKKQDRARIALDRAVTQCSNAYLVVVSDPDGKPTGPITAVRKNR